ncbi:hypothetical protein QUC31_014461, partial [Theobroma cacao]
HILFELFLSLCVSDLGEIVKLFADAGLIYITSLISPYRKDHDSCRAMLVLIFILFMFFSKLNCPLHVQVFMNMPLELCKARDSKSCLKLARAGKIKGFTSIDNPYEPPQNCE